MISSRPPPSPPSHTHTHETSGTQLHAHTHTGKAFRDQRRKDGSWGQLLEILWEKSVRESREDCSRIMMLNRRRRVDQKT